jgi:tetratricopeptide (TPR) repeat protein
MSADWLAVFRAARQQLRGDAPPLLPPQETWWGWLRAALAFQPAREQARDVGAPPGTAVRTSLATRGVTAPRTNASAIGLPVDGAGTPEAHTDHGAGGTRHGIALLAAARYEEATAVFSAILAEHPHDAFILACRAAAYRMLGRNDEAIGDASRAIELRPDSAWAYATRGAIRRLEKNYLGALDDLDKAIALEADYEWCIAGRGETYRLMGETDLALEDLDRALDLNPRNDWALMCRGAAYLDAQEDQLALRAFREAVNVNPDGDWALGLDALTYRLLGRDLTRYADEDA